MGLVFLVMFIGVPIAEIATFAWAGSRLGVVNTVGLVIGAGFLGLFLLRHQGMRTVTRAQAALAEGRIPSAELADGLLLILSAILLMVPGFITDVLALLVLFPGVKGLFRRYMLSRLAAQVRTGQGASFVTFGSLRPPDRDRALPHKRASETEIIDRGPPDPDQT